MKLEYARLIAHALFQPNPSAYGLTELVAWEVEEAGTLSPDNLEVQLQYGRRTMTVGEVLSLNIRHSVWHTGQLAALLA